MFDKYKKQIIMAFLIVVILFILSIFVVITIKGNDKNIEKKVFVKYSSSNRIVIDNSLPISDTLGKNIEESDKKQSYNVLSIKNENDEDVKYQIFVTMINPEGRHINGNYIKYYLTDENNVALDGFKNNFIPSYSSLLSLNDKPESKLLYTGKIKANSVKKVILRVWVSDSYAFGEDEESFNFNIGVRGK